MSFQQYYPAHDQTRTGHQTYIPYPFTGAFSPPSLPSRPGPSILMDGRSEGSLTVVDYAHHCASKDIYNPCRRQLITFDILPDDVLLEIFYFYVDEDRSEDFERIEEWITLAHVCRCWRSVVFQSPRRLNLRLVCTPETPARDTLDIWPPLPLIVRDSGGYLNHWTGRSGRSGVDNVIAALEHNDRVCQIDLSHLRSAYVRDSAAMLKPFPELIDLRLCGLGLKPRLPDSFLGGTTPRLRSLYLENIPFPGLPELLLSATHLVNLDLYDIPRSGYIPPEVMATTLSALTSLGSLRIHFPYPRPHPTLGSRRLLPPPPTRSILPSLTKFIFKGASEYLEQILARTDAPRLNKMHLYFFHQSRFDTPQLFQFISRRPTLRAPKKGHIAFTSKAIIVKFPSQTSDYDVLGVRIECMATECQLLSIEQVCTSSLPPLSTLEDLYIFVDRVNPPFWEDDVENTLWLDLLRPFAAVKNLYLCKKIVPHIAPVMQELVGARTTEVLPTLENIFLEECWPWGTFQEGMEKFVSARRLTSRPVAVSRWDRESL